MRKKYLVGTIAGGLMLVSMAISVQAADCGCGGMSKKSYNSLSGPACFSPPGCYLAPGCCECPPSACDNAWDGYCQHKAKWQAFFTKVGTPPPSYYYGHCNRGYGSPTPAVPMASETPTVKDAPIEPVPAPKPAVRPGSPQPVPPPPLPEKTTRTKVLYPWMR
jgi:hypothetical protein